MSERRHEVILRVPNLTPNKAAVIVAKLAPLASIFPGASLSEIVRDQFPDHQMHVSRKRHI